MNDSLEAPFSYFGGKSRVADEIWERLGDVQHYIEPFAGSAATLLARPSNHDIDERAETINDINGFITNFWRAIKWAPNEVAERCNWPISEIDQNSRRDFLQEHEDELVEKLGDDPEYYNAKIAAWWCWGACCWIGRGWPDKDSNQIPKISSYGEGILKKEYRGEDSKKEFLGRLHERLQNVRILCGDWERPVRSRSALKMGKIGTPVGILFDPPYPKTEEVYSKDSDQVAYQVETWCKEHEDDEELRIALCGYEGNYDLPNWDKFKWSAQGGYGNQSGVDDNENRKRERIWFSPHCIGSGNDIPEFMEDMFDV